MKIYLLLIIVSIQLIGYSQNLIPYRDKDKWGFADNTGKIIIKPKYKFASENTKELLRVKKRKHFIYLDKEFGEKLISGKFISASDFYSGQAFISTKNQKYCINTKGEKINPIRYCGGGIGIEAFFFGSIIKNNFIHYTDKENKEVASEWVALKENYQGIAAVKKDSLWGIINKDYKFILDYQFENIVVNKGPFNGPSSSNIIYKNNGKFGFISFKGEILTEAKYHKVQFFSEFGLAKVWVNDYFWGYINHTGKEFFNT